MPTPDSEIIYGAAQDILDEFEFKDAKVELHRSIKQMDQDNLSEYEKSWRIVQTLWDQVNQRRTK
jgi:hypothetical protein